MLGGRLADIGGFQSQELVGCEMMLGFRQVRAARERNTLHPVVCVLYELDNDEMNALWVSSRCLYRPGAVGYK